jgi:cobalt-zinc-cadmium efflux system protein
VRAILGRAGAREEVIVGSAFRKNNCCNAETQRLPREAQRRATLKLIDRLIEAVSAPLFFSVSLRPLRQVHPYPSSRAARGGEAFTLMSHSHAHGHSHAGHDDSHGGHGHVHTSSISRLRIALAITAVVLVAEAVGGYEANSLALLADAGHMLTDVAALALSLFVAWFSQRPETPKRTYGYLRLEILAAFLNGATLLLISVWIIWEAFNRLRTPEPVRGGLMLAVAALGLVANAISAWVLRPQNDDNMNVRGAYLHILGDLLGFVGTIVAAVLIHTLGWVAADTIASIIVSALILRGAWALVRDSVDVLLESTPSHISAASVRDQLVAIPGIESVHDLHVWTVTSNVIAMSVHAIVREPERHQHVLEHVLDAMRLFGISHVTVQLERKEMYERELHLHA